MRSSPEKARPEVAAEIERNRAPLFHSLLSLQMTTTQVNPHQTVLECCLLSQTKADKNREKISRESYNNQEGTDAFEFVIYPVVGHDGSVTSVNFSHDNNWLLTSSCDRTVRLWSHSQSDPLLILSSVNHNFATELGSSAKLKVSGLIYFGVPLLASRATNCNEVYGGVTRSHAKTSHERKRSFTARLLSCGSLCSPELESLIAS